MGDAWLTLEEAAKRVDRGGSTIRRWIADGQLRRFPNGRVLESQLLATDARMRARVGRPSGQRVPLVVDGRQVGHVTIRPDGQISGKITDTPET